MATTTTRMGVPKSLFIVPPLFLAAERCCGRVRDVMPLRACSARRVSSGLDTHGKSPGAASSQYRLLNSRGRGSGGEFDLFELAGSDVEQRDDGVGVDPEAVGDECVVGAQCPQPQTDSVGARKRVDGLVVHSSIVIDDVADGISSDH